MAQFRPLPLADNALLKQPASNQPVVKPANARRDARKSRVARQLHREAVRMQKQLARANARPVKAEDIKVKAKPNEPVKQLSVIQRYILRKKTNAV